MWRVTGDTKYRDWGWDIFMAIEKHCKVEGGGYSGVLSVLSPTPQKDDFQQSFFLAETLKYLFLTISNKDNLMATIKGYLDQDKKESFEINIIQTQSKKFTVKVMYKGKESLVSQSFSRMYEVLSKEIFCKCV